MGENVPNIFGFDGMCTEFNDANVDYFANGTSDTENQSASAVYVGWNQEWFDGVGTTFNYLLAQNQRTNVLFTTVNQSASNAAIKAFVTNRVGDFGFLIGLMLCFMYLGTLDLDTASARFEATTFAASVQDLDGLRELFATSHHAEDERDDDAELGEVLRRVPHQLLRHQQALEALDRVQPLDVGLHLLRLVKRPFRVCETRRGAADGYAGPLRPAGAGGVRWPPCPVGAGEPASASIRTREARRCGGGTP